MSDHEHQPPPAPQGWSTGPGATPPQGAGGYGVPNPVPGATAYGQAPAIYPEQSQAQTVLIIGLVSIVFCQLLAPVAWYMGNQEIKAIDEGRRSPEQRNLADIGRIIGMIFTILLILALVLLAVVFVLFAFGAAVSSSSSVS